MEEDLDLEIPGRKGKFARCIICSDYSIRAKCFNIFSTTLESGKILLSEFLKNVLDCSVLIVVSPEFFICKRCFTLCHNLDCSLARCNYLQGQIRTLFEITEKKLKIRKEGEMTEEDFNSIIEPEVPLKEETEDKLFLEESITKEEFYDDPSVTNEMDEVSHDLETVDEVDHNLETTDEVDYNLETVDEVSHNFETVEEVDQNLFLSLEVVESEVTVGDTDDVPLQEYSEDQLVTEVEVDKPLSQKKLDKNIVFEKELSQDTIVMCEVCGLCFENKKKLRYHKKSTLCNKDNKTKISSVYEFQNFSVKLKKKQKVFFCNRCTYEAKSSADISSHLKSHKTDPEYMCDICGRRFKFLKTFTRHSQIHDENRPFPCTHCAFRATTEVMLRIHERQHDDQKKFTCSKCGYKTLKKMSYLIHCRTHTGERPYCCPNCPYKAKDPSTLERHRRIHGGIRRYQCTICNYKSVQKAALTMHMKTHTGEKPYACEHCDYRSSARHNLKAHVAAIHCNEKPFACPHCSYRTKLKRLLTIHMRKHTDEKPYSCPICEAQFRYRGSLTYHLTKKHPVNEEGDVQTYYVLNYCESKKLNINGEDLVFSDEAESGSESEEES